MSQKPSSKTNKRKIRNKMKFKKQYKTKSKKNHGVSGVKESKFKQLVKEALTNDEPPYRISSSAIESLQEAMESQFVKMMKEALAQSKHESHD